MDLGKIRADRAEILLELMKLERKIEELKRELKNNK